MHEQDFVMVCKSVYTPGDADNVGFREGGGA